MKSLANKTGTLLRDNSSNPMIEDCAGVFRKAGFSDDRISLFQKNAISVLNDYSDSLGEGGEIRYRIAKTLLHLVLYVVIPGECINPFAIGKDAERRNYESIINLNLNTEGTRLSHKYAFGRNIISVSIPLSERKRSFLKDPMLMSVILGVVCGLICRQLPQEANSFILDEIATPVTSLILNMISGIKGPVIFISMTTSIIALDNINQLTNLGFKIIRRFVVATLFMIAVSIGVSAIIIRHFSDGNVTFKYDKLIGMILDIVPTNLIEPFLNNTTPQLVVLGFLLGIALLLLGDKVTELKKTLVQIDEWAMSAMRIVLIVTPAIPFLSIMSVIAGGKSGELLKGWKFVVATYIVFTICLIVKAVKTSIATKISIRDFWKKGKSIIALAFTTGSNSAPLKKAYEISEEEFNIKPEFTSFWMPMCSAMLSPKTTVNLVIATFMMASIAGVPVSSSFLLVMVIVTLELSLASPGAASAWTILFETLSLPTDYVGLFVAYRNPYHQLYCGLYRRILSA